MPDRSYLSIGEVLGLLRPEFPDLTISKIRFLESQGLLDPERTPSGYRKFYESDVERLRWVLHQQKEQYLPLKVIKGKLGDEPEDANANPDTARAGGATGGAAQRPGGGGGGEGGAAAAVEQRPSPIDGEPNPLQYVRTGVSMTLEELSNACGLKQEDVRDLERFGLLAGRPVAGTTYYDEEALIVANLAAGFLRHGVEARHLRMYKTSAEREAGFFEQLVMPLLKQRNPRSRRQAVDLLGELSTLGQGMRAAMLRAALRDHTGGP